jgi:mRNA degradation ribonuclease J1/J2
MSGSLGERIRPFAEASYLFQGDIGSDRQMRFTGGSGQNFTVVGVDPDHSIKGAVGVAVNVGAGTLFVRGDYHAGGDQQVGSVRGGLLFSF